MRRLHRPGYWVLITGLTFIPAITVMAQRPRQDHFILAVDSSQTSAIVTGSTGGGYSLASITNRDRNGNPCMGFGDPEPDHVMILENEFSQLSLKVNSRGSDTTLIVKGPGKNNIRCGYGKNNQRDAVVQDSQWRPGEYKIWVGSVTPNQRSGYRLSVQQ
ncbi:MAG: hypothetical protein AB4372_29920 [Xenococcus sp. (in: cyanobacteria)]